MSKISKDKQSDSVGREEKQPSLLDSIETFDDLRRLLDSIPLTTSMRQRLDDARKRAGLPPRYVKIGSAAKLGKDKSKD